MTKIKMSFLLIALFVAGQVFSQTVPYSKGRIAISSDGNEHDHDDWAATPLSLALLAAKGLQNKLVVYTYSDHVWGSNEEHPPNSNTTQVGAKQEMRISALEGKQQFNFNSTNFIEAVDNQNQAYNAMRDAILASTSNDPLTIIGAGPMHVIGEGIRRATVNGQYTNQLNHVRLISHSNWNNNHQHNNSYTWAKIQNQFASMGLTMDKILDQNGGPGYDGLRAVISKFNWINNSSCRNNPYWNSGSWDWLYARQETCIKKNGTEFDPSDAGMIVYLITGIEETEPSDAKAIMESPCNSQCTLSDITDLAASQNNCEVTLTWTDQECAEKYIIRRKLSGASTFTTLTTINAPASSYVDNGVTDGNSYVYQVRPQQGTVKKVSNNPTIVMDCNQSCTLSDITDLAASQSNCEVTLTWTDQACATEYIIRRKTNGGAYQNIATIAAPASSYLDNSVSDGNSYLYQVRPFDGTIKKVSNNPVIDLSCGGPSIEINVTSVTKDCNNSGQARNVIYFTVTGSSATPTASSGTIIADGSNWKLRDVPVTFGSTKTYTISVEGTSIQETVTAVSSCPKSTETITSNEEFNVRIYPNPAKDLITIYTSELTEVEFYNIQGQLIHTLTVDGQTEISVNTIGEPGMYFMSANGTIKKLVIR